MGAIRFRFCSRTSWNGLLTVLALIAVNFPAIAQIKPSRIPNLPGQNQTQSAPVARNSSGVPAPEVTSITPNDAPPGGIGELVFVGKNFTPDLKLRLSCASEQVDSKAFKVENPNRASAQISVPLDMNEGPCAVELLRPARPKPTGGETEESVGGTVEVYQVPENGPKFRITSASKMPVGLEVTLMAEGDVNVMAMIQKFAAAAQSGKVNKGYLLLSPDSLKYVQEDKTVFSKALSATKGVEELTMMGEATGTFRITFTDGKIYNFQLPGGEGEEGHAQFLLIKKKLGK